VSAHLPPIPERAHRRAHPDAEALVAALRKAAHLEIDDGLGRGVRNSPSGRLVHGAWMALRERADELGPGRPLEGPARALVAALGPFLGESARRCLGLERPASEAPEGGKRDGGWRL
jgi:hypothetical protein